MPDIVSMHKGTATLRWSRPQSDGGTPITTFRVERRTLGAYRWELVNPTERITETTYTVTALQPDTDYEFRILAENKVGVSAPSPASRSAKYGKSHSSFAFILATNGLVRRGPRVESTRGPGRVG